MRRNSGDDEGRDNFLDPTVKEHERAKGKSGAAVLDPDANKKGIPEHSEQRTPQMGSHARKTGQKGAGEHR